MKEQGLCRGMLVWCAPESCGCVGECTDELTGELAVWLKRQERYSTTCIAYVIGV